ncbi:class II aldolase/adducin family protein [Streptomyces adelaidensis]|uniref:class II aldolase/adducin family protein n=1 Tax=Streptomyces adelaidensis TaxID=2796465 RepID=UPI003558A98F
MRGPARTQGRGLVTGVTGAIVESFEARTLLLTGCRVAPKVHLADRADTVVDGDGPRHSGCLIHTEIMVARPDVGAVVYTHPSTRWRLPGRRRSRGRGGVVGGDAAGAVALA